MPLSTPEPQSAAASRDTVFLARQPILDRHGRVRAYELLYRGGGSDFGLASDAPDAATARVVHAAIMSVGLETLTPGCPAFLNVTRNLLMGDLGALLPSGSVVLEVLETVDVDDGVVERCRELHGMGYALALDDFVPGSPAERLFPFAQYVKVDVLSLDAAARREVIRAAPGHLRMLAEKVETAEVHAATLAEGFELFQGYYFCRPSTFHARDMSLQQSTSLRLLAALNRPNVTVTELDDLIKRDVSLCQRLLRYANSAALGVSQRVHSIRQALMLIGQDQVRRWISVWALTGLSGSGVSEVMTMAAVRARCCEKLGAKVLGVESSGALFLLGLCSMLDVLLERPMEDVLRAVSLPERTTDALRGYANAERTLLDAVIAYERGDWEQAASTCCQLGIRVSDIPPVYAEALAWATDLRQ
ncbi:MAG: HDOD domain-containing protein [Vicinamibacterales bacterium]